MMAEAWSKNILEAINESGSVGEPINNLNQVIQEDNEEVEFD